MDRNSSTAPSPSCQGEQALTRNGLPVHASIVLDTNVVLDWLLFRDPSSLPLAAAIGVRRVNWIATPAMRDEFADVLARGLAARRNAPPAGLLAAWDAQVTVVARAPRLPVSIALQCTDPDDQMFIELAHAARARWLLSRDRALLRLARKASAFGISITTPERWTAPP